MRECKLIQNTPGPQALGRERFFTLACIKKEIL